MARDLGQTGNPFSGRWLRHIFNSLSSALIVAEANEKVVFLNLAAEKALNISGEQSIGKPLRELIPDPTFLSALESLQQEGKEAISFDLELHTPPARQGTYHTCLSLILDGEKQSHGITVLLEDVTRERELDRAKNAFLATAAHELRTPLTAILGFSELLRETDSLEQIPPEERREFVDEIVRTGHKLSWIVDSLLDVGRMESGAPLRLEKSTLRIRDLLDKAVEPFRRAGARHHFEIVTPSEALYVCADRQRIQQVMDNLLSNAIKYSPRGGVIRIEASVDDEIVQISLRDQGIGMTPAQVDRVFDRLFRADTSTTAVGGLGLGMRLVRGIVEAHGGKIRVESVPGEGTCVIFTLPRLCSRPISKSEISQVMEERKPIESKPPSAANPPAQRLMRLTEILQDLLRCRELEEIMAVVRRGARELTGADGATFILREGGYSYYASEDAVSPLFEGKRFPLESCIGGWSILRGEAVAVEDVYGDERIPKEAYRQTFVQSLAVVPVRKDLPVAAIGAYWSFRHQATEEEMLLLQTLADATAAAMENAQRYEDLENRLRKYRSELNSETAPSQERH